MTPNIIKHHPDGKTVEVIITRRSGEQHSALFDSFLWPLLKNFKFHLHETRHKSGKFYVATYIKGKLFLAHCLVMEPFLSADYPEVDHIDPAATTDNRVRNLRAVNRHEQMRNTEANHHRHTVPTRPNYTWAQAA